MSGEGERTYAFVFKSLFEFMSFRFPFYNAFINAFSDFILLVKNGLYLKLSN